MGAGRAVAAVATGSAVERAAVARGRGGTRLSPGEGGVEILSNAEGVMQDPKPFGIVTGLGDSSIQISFFGWVDQSKHDFGKVRSAAMQHIKVEFDNRNIDMPEPIYKLRFEGAAPNLSGDAKSPKPGKTSGTPKHHAAKPTPSVAKDELSYKLLNADIDLALESDRQ